MKFLALFTSIKMIIAIVGFIIFVIIIGRRFQCNQVLITNNVIREENRTSIPRNLVIAAAMYTELTAMYRLVRSIRATCPFSAIVMIVAEYTMNDQDFKDLANLYSVIYISHDEYFPAHLKKNKALVDSIYSGRWVIIRNYLSILQSKNQLYDNIFICDAHDSLFQADVFAHITDLTPGLYVFQEDIYMNIGKCSLNCDWIRTCYNEVEMNKLSPNPIICSGTVLGTWNAIQVYLSVMESEILKAPINCTSFSGSDQGIHNYIIYNKKLSNIAVHQMSNEYGFVATLGYSLTMKRNQFGLVKNENGTIYAVIHQWNRSQQMRTQFQREYQTIPADVREKKN